MSSASLLGKVNERKDRTNRYGDEAIDNNFSERVTNVAVYIKSVESDIEVVGGRLKRAGRRTHSV
ncbi:hypothetical protein GB937_001168 [Aspergillus fischeri]|nr:hypothetical protein GB937_001168 [Aspergillus fischeri]